MGVQLVAVYSEVGGREWKVVGLADPDLEFEVCVNAYSLPRLSQLCFQDFGLVFSLHILQAMPSMPCVDCPSPSQSWHQAVHATDISL